MLDILLWVLCLTIGEGGSIFLAVWIWKLFDEVDSYAKENWCICGFIFAIIVAVAIGIMLAASAVLGTVKLFGMYG